MYLFKFALTLISMDNISDPEIFRFRDQLIKRKSSTDPKCTVYLEGILDRAIDLSDAIKEIDTPWGDELFSISEKNKHLAWLENQKEFLKNLLTPPPANRTPYE